MPARHPAATVPASPRPLFWVIALTVLAAGMLLLPAAKFFDRPVDYLPLHTGLEFVSLAVCSMVFALAWKLRDAERNSHMVLLGATFLYIALAVVAHTLSYTGMPDFVTPSGPTKAIAFWLAERMGMTLAMLGLAFLPLQSWSGPRCLAIFGSAAAAAAITWWVCLFHLDWLPETFVAGKGPTPFKTGAEYLISAIDAVLAIVFLRRGRKEGNGTLQWLGAAAWVLAMSGLFFTLYVQVTDTFNFLGHVYKALAYAMIHQALFAAGVQAPFQALRQLGRVDEERLRMALETANMNVFEYDPATDRVHREGRVTQTLGLTSDATGADYIEQIHPDDRPAFLKITEGLCPERPNYAFEYRFRGADGSYHWLVDHARAQFDDQGRIVHLVGVCTDISERKQAEIALTRHAERQALLLEIASGLLQAGNNKAELTRAVFEKVGSHLDADVCLTYRIDEESATLRLVAGFGIPDELRPTAQRLPLKRAFCGTVAITGLPLNADERSIGEHERGAFIRRLGARAYACHPLLSRDGRVLGTFSVGSTRRDCFRAEEIDFLQTIAYFLALAWERRRAEREIQRLNADLERRVDERTAQLQASNTELQAFTYAASHDMKGPLGRINSFGTLLEQKYRDRLDGDGLLFLGLIRRNTLRLTNLIEDLLAHARIEQHRFAGEPVELGAAVRFILNEKEEDIREAGAELRLDLPATELRVLADFHGLAQVLRNLVENALKYSATATPPAIEIGCRQEDETCLLWVKDNGVGFDMTYHDRIFEIFRRLHTYDEFPGSGIGLALVKKAMERMAGKVWAESAPGQGASFFLRLPAGNAG